MDKKSVFTDKKEIPIVPPHIAAAKAEADAKAEAAKADEAAAKKQEAAIFEKQKADEAADKKAEASKAATVREEDKAAIKEAAENELQAKQVYEEYQHENPFDNIFRAQIVEVRKNSDGKAFVQFVAFRADNPDIKEPIASLPEAEFRARFVKLVSPSA